VLHAFQKKSKRGIATPKQDIACVRERLKIAERLSANVNKKASL
jgi:phage-related protein